MAIFFGFVIALIIGLFPESVSRQQADCGKSLM